jgi:tetratricopeptide (TPR) repeat protein
MFDLGFLLIPLLSLLAVFGIAIVTDINMIAFDVQTVPEVTKHMGYDEKTVRDTIMFKIYDISQVAASSRGVGYSTISDMQNQSLKNVSETLGIENGVLAVQGFLGLVPYRLKGKLVREGDMLYLVINGFSSNDRSFNFTLKTDEKVFESVQSIKGHSAFLGGTGDTTNLVITNADTEITTLLDRAAEAIVDRIDPYLLARYYFVLESPQATFTKTIPQLVRCLEVLPKEQRHWPLLLWGRIYQSMGDYDKALEVYREMERLQPHFPFSQLRMGEILATRGRHQEAIALYQKAIDNSRYYPSYPVARSAAYSLWANSLIALGRMDEAQTVLEQGVSHFSSGGSHSPANAISQYALGQFLMTYRHDYDGAEYHLRKAIYLDDSPTYYEALQQALTKRVPGYSAYLAKHQKQDEAAKADDRGTAAESDAAPQPDKALAPLPVPRP